MKSSLSRIPLSPSSVTWLHSLKPSTHGMLPTRIKMPLKMTAFLRLQPKVSMNKAIMFSNTASTVDRLAKVINRKNRLPHSCPPDMFTNTLGRVIKIKDGPASGRRPKAKQAGKIIMPAIIATKVSRAQMRTDSPASP